VWLTGNKKTGDLTQKNHASHKTKQTIHHHGDEFKTDTEGNSQFPF
jgi:hypothetical protein